MGDSNDVVYDLNAISQLLIKGFTVAELRAHLLVTPAAALRPIRERLLDKSSGLEAMEVIVDFCDRQVLFPELLAELERWNPRRYVECGPYAKGERQVEGPSEAARPPEQAADDHLLTLHVTRQRVTVTYDAKEYHGPCALDPDELCRLAAKSPQQYGEHLFEGTVHGTPLPGGNRRSTTLFGYDHALLNSGGVLTVELQAGDPEVDALFWEFLKDPESEHPMTARAHCLFYRRARTETSRFRHSRPPLRIMAAVCSPRTLGGPENRFLHSLVPLNVEMELEMLQPGMGQLEAAGLAEYTILESATGAGPPVSLKVLDQALSKGCDVLHLIAHSYTTWKRETYLVMEGPDRTHEMVHASELARYLLDRGLALVVLAACQGSADQSDAARSDLVTALERSGIPAIVALQGRIYISSARQFTEQLYSSLAQTGRIDLAMARARQTLYRRLSAGWQWGVPVLHMSRGQGKLLDV